MHPEDPGRELVTLASSEPTYHTSYRHVLVCCRPLFLAFCRVNIPFPSVILGRAIKNEYLALGTIFGTVGIAMLATGGKKEAAPPSGSSKSTLESVKEAVKFNASSRCVSAFSMWGAN